MEVVYLDIPGFWGFEDDEGRLIGCGYRTQEEAQAARDECELEAA